MVQSGFRITYLKVLIGAQQLNGDGAPVLRKQHIGLPLLGGRRLSWHLLVSFDAQAAYCGQYSSFVILVPFAIG